MANKTKYSGYVASVVSLTAALFVLGVVFYVGLGWRGAMSGFTGDITMSVMVADSITEQQKSAIEQRVGAKSEIKNAKFITKESSMSEFSAYLGQDIIAILGDNPLPALYSLSIDAGSTSKESMEALKADFAAVGGVTGVVYESEITDRFASGMASIAGLLTGFAAVLLFVALVLIYNTTRLMIGAAAGEIRTMRLVGAPKSVIFAPFLKRAVIGGAVAGVFASGAVWFGIAAAGSAIELFKIGNEQLLYIFSSVIVAGVVASLLSTYISLNQQINR